MTTLRALRSRVGERPPAATMLLEPTAYASDYQHRPDEPVAVGIRLLSEADVQAAKAAAARVAVDLYEDERLAEERDLAYNDALVREVVARVACDPNDARNPFFPGDEEEVRLALTSDGCRAIYDEWEAQAVSRSPLQPVATEEDVAALPATWARAAGLLQGPEQRRMRRLLGAVLRALREAEERGETVSDEEA